MNLFKIFNSVRGRVQYGTLALALLPMIIVAALIGTIAFFHARTALQERVAQQTTSLRNDKAQQIVDYFNSLAGGVKLMSELRTVEEAFATFKEAVPAITTTVDAATAKDRMQRFYLGEFQQEYTRENSGIAFDAKPVLEQMTDVAYALQYLYIGSNPNPIDTKNKLDAANDNSAYTRAHAILHPRMRSHIEAYGYDDILLVDIDTGVIDYTYVKGIELGTSLLNGPYAKTNLGNAFRAARDGTEKGKVVLADYAAYAPSFGDAAAFLATVVYDGTRKVGIIIAQVPIASINAIVTFNHQWEESGLGKTGEIYLAGPDFIARSNSRGLIENKEAHLAQLRASGIPEEQVKQVDAHGTMVGIQKLTASAAITDALKGNTGSLPYVDYRGVPVIGSYAPLDVLGLKWVILAKNDRSEAFAPIYDLLRYIVLAGLGIVTLALLISAFFSTRLARSINQPIGKLQDTVARLADGDLGARTHLNPTDELGQLGKALDDLLDDRVNTMALAARENEQLNHSVIEIMQAVSRLSSRDLTVKVPVTTDITGAISDALNVMTAQTAQVLRNVDDISGKVADASNRVKERSDSAIAVAAEGSKEIEEASKELSQAAAALKDIAARAGDADRVAEEAIQSTREAMASVRETVGGISASRDLIRETEKRIKRLGERSQEITSTVNLIGNIAERTSLLALNTSMQAVAAGEAGRAYAVVADEVKRLAEGARSATQQISNLVGAIQSETVDTVEAINRAIAQVVDINKLAERAGEQMRSTEEKTEVLVNSVRSIAQTTHAQSRASDALQARALQIRKTTRETTDQLESQADETRSLNDYAADLLESVRVFTLPQR